MNPSSEVNSDGEMEIVQGEEAEAACVKVKEPANISNIDQEAQLLLTNSVEDETLKNHCNIVIGPSNPEKVKVNNVRAIPAKEEAQIDNDKSSTKGHATQSEIIDFQKSEKCIDEGIITLSSDSEEEDIEVYSGSISDGIDTENAVSGGPGDVLCNDEQRTVKIGDLENLGNGKNPVEIISLSSDGDEDTNFENKETTNRATSIRIRKTVFKSVGKKEFPSPIIDLENEDISIIDIDEYCPDESPKDESEKLNVAAETSNSGATMLANFTDGGKEQVTSLATDSHASSATINNSLFKVNESRLPAKSSVCTKRRAVQEKQSNSEVEKCQRAVEMYTQKIESKGNEEVDLSDEKGSTFIRLRKMKKRLNVFKQKLRLNTPEVVPIRRVGKIPPNLSQHPEIGQALNTFMKSIKLTPAYEDIFEVVQGVISAKALTGQAEVIAKGVLHYIVKKIKSIRRQEMQKQFQSMEPDPADSNPELATKLELNKANRRIELEYLEEYERQHGVKNEETSSDESEDEDSDDELDEDFPRVDNGNTIVAVSSLAKKPRL